ncbi:hypothetical protein GH714_022993 [Hevea brasiliensis]|uniref:Protein kinase domain-containing protein n=1 Tax=Hevea brasiliensis TaxID=3981 RepID=A0A6A6KNC5_HEVBR|nr:hypothetical protein GH714_022993 [Hevea brasiliensis]
MQTYTPVVTTLYTRSPLPGNTGLPNASCTEVHASNIGTDAGDGMSILSLFPTADAQCTFNGVPEPDCSVTSPQVCVDARISDNCSDHSQSLVKIQRSKSRQRALELRSSAKATKSHSCDENNATIYTSQGIGSGINSIQLDHVDELELVKPVDTNTEDCEEAGAKIDDDGLKKCMNESTEKPVNELPEQVKPSVLPKANCKTEEANVVDCRGNEMINNVVSDRITRSRSSISQASTSKEPALQMNNNVVSDSSSSFADEDGVHRESVDKSAKHPNSVRELLKLVKPSSAISCGSYGSSKAKARDKLIKDKGSSISVGRITRSRSSSRQTNCVNECLEIDNSSRNGKEDGVSKPKQLFNHDDGLRDFVNPIGITYKSPGLKAKVRNCQNVDASSDTCCHRITSSSSTDVRNISEFPKVDLCSDVIKDGDGILAQSFGKSSKLPQQSSFVEGRINLQVLSISQPNVVPCTDRIPADTVIDYDGLVLARSVLSEYNSDGGRCGVEVLELRPPSECVMPVKPKQLNFDNVEQSSLLETSSPAVENKQEKPNPSIEMPLLEQEFSIKEEKPWKVSSEAHMKDSADLVDESTVYPVQQKMDVFISQNQNADSCIMGSWPRHKRRKIEGQVTDAFSASPILKVGDAVQSVVERSPLKDVHWNMEHQKTEEYEVSSSKLPVEEIEISSEGRGRSASTAFNLMLEQGAPSVSSLEKLAGEKVTGQHTAEEKVLFQLEDKLEVGGAEVLNYTEDTMTHHLDRKDLSYCSSGSHSQSVICTDQIMPDFEGFVMETDNEQPCTSKEVIYFDKLDIPPTGLGHASVLERLCKSTCLDTSISRFSATYKLHEALNLYQSIPNGLLESIELRSTLHMNGDNEQLVGKLWDGIPPKSSSSGKRVSSIPELPCISEESEITEGVIDIFLEVVGPEVMISSVTREPPADITKNSNPLVSVCEAEINDDRHSFASLNTEFSFSGTCDRARQKLGNQNKNKRRFTSEDKENQNLPLEGDGLKRGNGSLHGRFSKLKLSGKTDLVKGGLGLSEKEKESKCTNIVSNVASFIPFVQQKQAAAVITVYLKRLQHLGHCFIVYDVDSSKDGRANERKESKCRLGKHEEIEKAEEGHNLQTMPDTEPTTTKVSTIDTINASIIPEDSEALSNCGDNSKVMGYICKESVSLLSNVSQEQSYEISPYKVSDDEDEEEDDNIPNSKFVPHGPDPFLVLANNVSFDFSSLTLRNLTLLGDSYLRNGVVGLTRDVTVPSSSSGTVIYNIPPGRFLGLVNSSQLTKNKFVAIEFDTRLDAHFNDPNENHVGLDIDSLDSIKSANPSSQNIDLKSGNSITAWINYKNDLRVLNVFLSYSSLMPATPLLTVDVDLSGYLKEAMYVGFSGSTEGSTELHLIESWSFETSGFLPVRPKSHPHNVSDTSVTVTTPIWRSAEKHHKGLGLGLGIAGPAFFCVFLAPLQRLKDRSIPMKVKLTSLLNVYNCLFEAQEFGSTTGLSPVSTLTAGTMGYLAPEYLHYGKATERTDVFSYGVVMLEVACGRRPIERESESQKMVNLVDWVWALHGQGKIIEAADKRLNGEFKEEEMRRLLLVGLSCANPDSMERPTMRRVLQILNGEAEPMIVPKVKPTLTFSAGLSLTLEDIVSDCE